MLQKTYRSGANLILKICTKSTKSLRISFDSNGHFFVYKTTDPEIQEGMEKHPSYGISYELAETIDLDNAPQQTEEEKVEEKTETTLTEVPVGSLADAKEYLAENYGYARSNLRSKVAIEKAALEHGVKFTGI